MNLNPSTIHEVVIDGHSLTIETFLAVARFGAKVSVSEQALAQMQRSRELAEKIASEKRVAYGITTGFGDLPASLFPKKCPTPCPPTSSSATAPLPVTLIPKR